MAKVSMCIRSPDPLIPKIVSGEWDLSEAAGSHEQTLQPANGDDGDEGKNSSDRRC